MALPNLYRLRSTITVGGVPCLFTTYWGNAGLASGTAVATEAAARVRAFWNSLAGVIASSSVLAIDTNVAVLDPADGDLIGTFTGSAPATVTFTATGDNVPLMSQALLRYATGQFINGRALVGRSFIPGLVETGAAGAGPTVSVQAAINTAAGLLGTTVTTAITQAVWHRPTPALPTSGQAWDVTGRSVSNAWAVQKGRRP